MGRYKTTLEFQFLHGFFDPYKTKIVTAAEYFIGIICYWGGECLAKIV